MTFTGNVDNGPRNRWFGDGPDYHFVIKQNRWGNELLGRGLHSSLEKEKKNYILQQVSQAIPPVLSTGPIT